MSLGSIINVVLKKSITSGFKHSTNKNLYYTPQLLYTKSI